MKRSDPGYKKWWRKQNPAKAKAQNKRDNFKTSLKKHSLTVEQYTAMFNEQKGVCAICGRAASEKKSLCIDHNHTTGQVRGLLCVACNLFLGRIGDSPVIAKIMLDYLTKDRQ